MTGRTEVVVFSDFTSDKGRDGLRERVLCCQRYGAGHDCGGQGLIDPYAKPRMVGAYTHSAVHTTIHCCSLHTPRPGLPSLLLVLVRAIPTTAYYLLFAIASLALLPWRFVGAVGWGGASAGCMPRLLFFYTYTHSLILFCGLDVERDGVKVRFVVVGRVDPPREERLRESRGPSDIYLRRNRNFGW